MANEKGKLSDDEVAYMRILGNIIDKYEEEHFLQELGPEPGGREVLEFLMEQHGLRQVDLRDEIGTQSVVSEVLSGRRWLTLDQIHKLAKRFRISPALLLNE